VGHLGVKKSTDENDEALLPDFFQDSIKKQFLNSRVFYNAFLKIR
jgi:hypothetical protein